jgi:hypothetical protein
MTQRTGITIIYKALYRTKDRATWTPL